MPVMLPSTPAPDSPPSERYVFSRLQASLPDSTFVFHARRFVLPTAQGAPQSEGELDFLIFDPARGMLGLEVKGGGVGRSHAGWTSTNRDGAVHPIADPGRQAQNAMHQIHRYLAAAARGSLPRFGWGVVFPDIDVTRELGPDLPRTRVIDRLDLADPAQAIARMFDTQKIDGPPLTRDGIDALVRRLVPCFHLVPSLAARLAEESQALVRLTEEQIRMLRALDRQPRLAVEGGAGTGKTVLAMERARRLGAEGKRVLLLCFNRPLADALVRDAQGFLVDSFHGYCRVMVERAGLEFRVPEQPKAQQHFWEHEAPGLLLDALALRTDERFDAVIVDEGQDFRSHWWPVIEELLHQPRSDVLSVFFDPHQNIYGGGPPDGLAVAPLVLTWNCRNTVRIAEWCSKQVGAPTDVHPDAPEGEPVEEIDCADEAAVVEAVRKVLHRFVVEERLACDRLVVLSTHNPARSVLGKHRKLGPVTLVSPEDRKEGSQVRFLSLQRFKGLEADVVILVDVEPGARTNSSMHLYVGASRARHRLVVVRRGV